MRFKWYWLLEIELLMAVVIGGGAGITMLLPGLAKLVGVAVSVALGIAANRATAYRDKLHERLGSSRVKPPMVFKLFSWMLFTIVIVGLLMYILWKSAYH